MNIGELKWRIGRFLQNLLQKHRTIEDYFESLRKIAESDEERNERLAKRVELKKDEFDLKQRILGAKIRSKELKVKYQEYDPGAPGRYKWKVYGMITLGTILLFLFFKACSGC